MILDTVIDDPRWNEATLSGGLEGQAMRAFETALDHLGLLNEDWEVSLLGCNDARIAELNAEFRDKDKATNVLSWPAQELAAAQPGGQPDAPEVDFMGDAALGDIAIAYETCLHEAKTAEKPLSDHLTHLLVHGLLHLLGYDHIRDADATVMETLETEILGKLGIANPYVLEDRS